MTVSKKTSRMGAYKILVILSSLAVIAVVIALILSQTAFLRPAPGADAQTPTDEEKPLMNSFKLPRAAVGGVNCIGGTGNDRAVYSLAFGDAVYTVGESDSHDRDLLGAPSGRSLFVAVSDRENTVRRVVSFGSSEDDSVVDVKPAYDGLKILTQSSLKTAEPILYTFDYETETVSGFAVAHPDRLRAKGLLPVGTRVYLFADNYSAGTDFHRLIVYCLDGEKVVFVHTVTDSAVSYEFCQAYPAIDGCTALIDAREGNYTYPAIVKIEDLDYNLTPLRRKQANTKYLASYPVSGGFRMLLATDAGCCLINAGAAGSVNTLANFARKGAALILPYRGKDCVVFLDTPVCYLYADGRTETREFDSPVADARIRGEGVELLLRGAKEVSLFELGNAVTAAAPVKLDSAKFGNDDTVFGAFCAGMGGVDAALVRLSPSIADV